MSGRTGRPAREAKSPAGAKPAASRGNSGSAADKRAAREAEKQKKKAYEKSMKDIDKKKGGGKAGKPGPATEPAAAAAGAGLSVSQRMKALVDAERLEQMAARKRNVSAQANFVQRHAARAAGEESMRRQYEDMRPFQLRKLCHEHGIDDFNCTKDELVQKLLDNAAGRAEPPPLRGPVDSGAGHNEPGAGCGVLTRDELSRMKFSDLAALARETGLSNSQIDSCQDTDAPRAELIAMMLAQDGNAAVTIGQQPHAGGAERARSVSTEQPSLSEMRSQLLEPASSARQGSAERHWDHATQPTQQSQPRAQSSQRQLGLQQKTEDKTATYFVGTEFEIGRPSWRPPRTKPRRLDDDPNWLREAGYLEDRVSAAMMLEADDFEETAGLENSAARRKFERVFREDLATKLGIAPDRIVITGMSAEGDATDEDQELLEPTLSAASGEGDAEALALHGDQLLDKFRSSSLTNTYGDPEEFVGKRHSFLYALCPSLCLTPR
eukprot:COSAG05_NODE_2971_length_2453_cov_1.440102_1_plen_495_part_00